MGTGLGRTSRAGIAALLATSIIAGCGPRPTAPETGVAPVAMPLPSAPTGVYGGAAAARMAPMAPPPAIMMEPGDSYPDAAEDPIKLTAEEPVSTFSADVDTASYANIRRFVEDGEMPPADAVRAEEIINYFRYAYPASTDPEQPFTPTVAVYPSPWREGAQIVHIGITAGEVDRDSRPAASLVFLVDVSGSMQSPDKLAMVQRSLRMMLDGLRDDDEVAIVTYAGYEETVLPPTPGAQKAKIAAAIEKLSAGGGTGGEGGIRAAYALAKEMQRDGRISRVVMATDGDFNLGISDPAELKDFIGRYRGEGVFLTYLGVGRGNYRDDTAQALAQAGNGVAYYLDSLHEARKVLQEQLGGTLLTVASDVKFQVEFNPAEVAEYRLIGYETRMLRRQDFNDDKIDAGDIGAGHRVTALYEIVPPGSPARMIDPSRYQAAPAADAKPGEIGFLRIRWKKPGEEQSRLMERPIAQTDRVRGLDVLAPDFSLAAAAAAYAQKLQGSSFLKDYGWDNIAALAERSTQGDGTGERWEFVQLVKLAGALPATP